MSIMKKNVNFVIAFTIMLSNIIPIVGPCVAAQAIGRNLNRFKHRFGLKNKTTIISLVIGTLIFFIIIGFLLFFGVEFSKTIYFWYMMSVWFLAHILLTFIFYFLGKDNYKMKIPKNKK